MDCERLAFADFQTAFFKRNASFPVGFYIYWFRRKHLEESFQCQTWAKVI